MKFVLEYPVVSDLDDRAWLDPDNMIRFAATAEEAGVDALALTDHPAPSKKWLEHGGHETFDPMVALGFFAAATKRIRLMTHLTVVPYRNPLLLAKSMTSVDVLSGGRATFVVGTGYLRSEFAALGVNFDERNDLFDEAIEVLHGIWSTDEFSYEGRHFKAVGQIIKPGPVQKPHPPLWLGGNASVVRDRVARVGQGWAPMVGGGATLSRTARTRAIESDDDLATMIEELRDRLEANGRDRDSIDIMASTADDRPNATDDAARHVEAIDRLTKMGVTWTSLPLDRSRFAPALDAIRRFGEEVIAPAR
jgi:probable F420-dependent oxidoreductase